MNEQLERDGFVLIEDVFSYEQIKEMRDISLKYFLKGGGFDNEGGKAKPDWMREDELRELLSLYELDKIAKMVSDYVGEDVEYIGHNDLHLNRSVGWHKDQLNGEARKFQINSPWEIVDGEVMKIFKVNLYLQDHSKNEDGLTVLKGSHKFKEMDSGHGLEQVRPRVGDIVLFDQRISHKASYSGGYNRLLICLGFGVRNVFFDQFKKGTEFRQNKQNGFNKTREQQ